MSRKYLLLGASSEVCLAFMQQHQWHKDDEIIAQYYKNKASLDAIKEKLPAKLDLWQADFSDKISTDNFVERLSDRGFVPTHILHVPAVPIASERFTEIEWENAEEQIYVQCRSIMLILQAIIKKMSKAKTGKIVILLSSCTLNEPPKYMSGYVMAKYALMGLGKSLAAEYAHKKIQVNMISPSMMETKFVANMYSGIMEQSAANNPMGRNVTPSDVAGTIDYLFSDNAGFINGVNIPVTGGEVF